MQHKKIEDSIFKTNTCVGFIARIYPVNKVPGYFFFRIIIKKSLSQQCLPRIPAFLWTNSAESGGRFKSWGEGYFGGTTGGTEKVIPVHVQQINVYIICSIAWYLTTRLTIWGVTLMQKLQRVLDLMNIEISDIYSQWL